MGTHNYTAVYYRNSKSLGPIDFSVLDFKTTNAKSTNALYSDETYSATWPDSCDTFMRGHTCREAVTNWLRQIMALLDDFPQYNYIGAIRCFNYQYSTVAEMLTSKKKAQKVAKMLSNLLDIEVTLDRGKIEAENWGQYGRGTNEWALYGREPQYFLTNRYVTVYFRFEKNQVRGFPYRISALLALLREPILIDAILNGASTIHELISVLISISYNRLTAKDSSYLVPSMLPTVMGFTMSQVVTEIQPKLQKPANSDGSDWYSLLYLAMFIEYINTTSSDFFPENNGPVNLMIDVISKYSIVQASFFRKYVEKEYCKVAENYLKKNYPVDYYIFRRAMREHVDS